MICGVHGSPANKLTDPILSKRKPAGTALICAAGFFIWAQPAIPASAAPAMTQLNKSFFISMESELLANGVYRCTLSAAILRAR
jgi:hypothetical protein